MGSMGIDGESSDAGHGEWTSLNGSGTPGASQPAGESAGGSDGPGSSSPGAAPGGRSPTPLNVGTIVLAGLMLLALAGTFYLANNARKKNAPDPEEIVFDPVEIPLDDGSVVLNARYTTTDYEFFQADGEEEIPLSIIKKEGTSDLYTVSGTLNGIQMVGVDGMDKGEICTVQIKQEVTYNISGTFRAGDACRFELNVAVTSTGYSVVAQGCSVDINLDFSPFYVAPFPDPLVFTAALSPVKSAAFTFFLQDVKLPGGVNCPLISSP